MSEQRAGSGVTGGEGSQHSRRQFRMGTPRNGGWVRGPVPLGCRDGHHTQGRKVCLSAPVPSAHAPLQSRSQHPTVRPSIRSCEDLTHRTRRSRKTSSRSQRPSGATPHLTGQSGATPHLTPGSDQGVRPLSKRVQELTGSVPTTHLFPQGPGAHTHLGRQVASSYATTRAKPARNSLSWTDPGLL